MFPVSLAIIKLIKRVCCVWLCVGRCVHVCVGVGVCVCVGGWVCVCVDVCNCGEYVNIHVSNITTFLLYLHLTIL